MIRYILNEIRIKIMILKLKSMYLVPFLKGYRIKEISLEEKDGRWIFKW